MKTWNSNKTALLMIALTALIAWLILGCLKYEIIPPSQKPYGFIDVTTSDAIESGNFDIIYDTIPVEEYYTVSSKLANADTDSIWSDTIYNVIQRPLYRWLEDGFTFVVIRKDTSIVYLDGKQGVWLSEDWRYWTLED